jgi:carboxymethylenebutenolidase
VLVIQEIFGVNAHIRSVVERFAGAGFVAIAPALFDPVERASSYATSRPISDGPSAGLRAGLRARGRHPRCCASLLQDEGLRVGAVGFCWGGSLAFLCNTRLGLPAVSYYGARTVPFLDEPARAPLMFHFGERDDSISAADIALHREQQPQAQCSSIPQPAMPSTVMSTTRRMSPPALRWPGNAPPISSRRS